MQAMRMYMSAYLDYEDIWCNEIGEKENEINIYLKKLELGPA